jgi:hypothetical protein
MCSKDCYHCSPAPYSELDDDPFISRLISEVKGRQKEFSSLPSIVAIELHFALCSRLLLFRSEHEAVSAEDKWCSARIVFIINTKFFHEWCFSDLEVRSRWRVLRSCMAEYKGGVEDDATKAGGG